LTIEPTYYIYRHIRPDKNEPFYIGIGKHGTKRSLHKRRNSIWNNIVTKNQQVYDIDILFEDLSLQEASEKEIEFIALYGRIKDGGILANILKGGHDNKDYRKLSPEQLQDITNRLKGNKYMLGKQHTESTKQLMSAQRIGNKSNTGRNLSEDTKEKMRESAKGNLSNTGKISITNGLLSKMIPIGSDIPEGWYRGGLKGYKLSKEFRDNCSITRRGRKLNITEEGRKVKIDKLKGKPGLATGTFWITNDENSLLIRSEDVIPEGYRKGRKTGWNTNKKVTPLN